MDSGAMARRGTGPLTVPVSWSFLLKPLLRIHVQLSEFLALIHDTAVDLGCESWNVREGFANSARFARLHEPDWGLTAPTRTCSTMSALCCVNTWGAIWDISVRLPVYVRSVASKNQRKWEVVGLTGRESKAQRQMLLDLKRLHFGQYMLLRKLQH